MSVLLYDPAEKTHVLLLRDGPWAGKRWSVDLRVCSNPCCGCFHIDFLYVPADGAPNSQAASAHVVLDIEKRSVYRALGHNSPATSNGAGAIAHTQTWKKRSLPPREREEI